MFDVIIVGAGPAGIFSAYELIKNNSKLKILLLDKGANIFNRHCPILDGKIDKCPPAGRIKTYPSCFPACAITNGFGGAGAYSDGKFNITTGFGGWMADYVSEVEVIKLIKYVDSINLEHGATTNITDPTTDKVKEIEKRGYASGLKLLRAQVRHLGTEQNLEILKSIYNYLKDKIDMRFSTEVEDIVVTYAKMPDSSIEYSAINGVLIKNESLIEYAKNVIIAPGRDGSVWLAKILKNQGLKMINNHVDIGVRVETSDIVMSEINEHLYEGKFIFNSSSGAQVRTFCSNPSGHVVIENHTGFMAANGHSYRDPNMGSNNTNFAILVSHKFTEPFDRPNEYAQAICKLANDLSNGGIIIQKYGDLINGRRSTEKRIKEGFIRQTFGKAVPGDLGLVLPYNTIKSIIEMIEALNHVTPGISSDHTLMYGVEAKFYSARPELSNNFETKIKGLYTCGDGAGISRGLAQAGAQGIHVARNILINN